MRSFGLALLLMLSACASAPPATPPQTFAATMEAAETQPILERTLRLHLGYDDSALSEGERAAVRELLAAGARMHALYLDQRHPQALATAAFLQSRPDMTAARDLFRLNSGPVATTLDNMRRPFLNVSPETAPRNVYPLSVTRASFDAFLAAHPDRRAELLDPRAHVWEASEANRARARAALDRHPTLDVLHPGLRERLARSEAFLAVPHSVAYADDMVFLYERLHAAAALVEPGDAAFARYLRLRARDLLADEYEGGDAAWVSARFSGNLNAQIGAYETYDDALYGVKTFFSLSLLQRDGPRSAELAAALGDIQLVENALPYDAHKEVRSNIPVGVYNIIADFGQARGANTATILPNEAYLARQYGRTILMRGNILLNDELFEATESSFNAAVADAHHGDLTPQGGFDRTLWHEIGHYLGADQTADGRDLGAALEDTADLLEEMKADLVSLTAARILHERGVFDNARLRAIHASGIRRVLQKNQPRRDQAYGVMQLIQWNWFLEHGLLRFADGRLSIDYARYPAAVEGLLRETLALQRSGDRAAANAFVARWTQWRPDLHEIIAERMRATERHRFNLVTYDAIDGAR